MRISGISQRTPTMVYDLRPMHLYTYISQLYLSSHFSKNIRKTLSLFTVNMISLQQIKSLIHSYLQKRISTRILDIVLCVSRLINAIANSALYILKQNIKKLQYPAVAPLLPKKMLWYSTRENSRYVFSEKTEEICKLKVNMFSV